MSSPENGSFSGEPMNIGVDLQSKAMDLESGHLGRFFGNHRNAAANIAGLIVLILIIAGIGFICFFGWEKSAEFWKGIFPIITLTLGYLFGRTS